MLFLQKKVKEAGLVWIGPDSEVIAKMGDKNAARNLMIANGIPVVPRNRSSKFFKSL